MGVLSARFVWVRYGAVDVVHPELVTETSAVRPHPDFSSDTLENDIALIRLNRVVEPTDNIKPAPLADREAEAPASAKVCGYGGVEDVPGEQLICKIVKLEATDDSLVADEQTTKFDRGTPVVADGAIHGILVGAGEPSVFLKTAAYQDWIDGQIEDNSAVMFVDA